MYEPGLSKKDLAEMATAGLTEADLQQDDVEIWPENLLAYNLFVYIRTQWRGAGMGVIGLDYTPLHHKMDRMGLSPEAYVDLESDIQVMEAAAIGAMNERDEQE